MLNTYKTILTKKTQLNSDTYLYHFDLLEPKEINFHPGQYLMLKVPSDKGPVSRLYSISSSSLIVNNFELIIQIIPGGLASSYLSNFKVQDQIVFQGPAGMFRLRENDKQKIFLVTGTGIAPVRSMLNSKFEIRNSKFSLFWGVKNYKDVYLLDELKQFNPKICLSREQNLEMVPEIDKKYFDLGHVDSFYEKQWDNCEFYLCGGRDIVESLKLGLLTKNISLENIIFEKF